MYKTNFHSERFKRFMKIFYKFLENKMKKWFTKTSSERVVSFFSIFHSFVNGVSFNICGENLKKSIIRIELRVCFSGTFSHRNRWNCSLAKFLDSLLSRILKIVISFSNKGWLFSNSYNFCTDYFCMWSLYWRKTFLNCSGADNQTVTDCFIMIL